MKAPKTIVAAAVIALAFTAVAVAGVLRIGSWGDAEGSATGPTATQTHHVAGLTLTDGQFARLLRAANGQAAKPHTPQTDHETTRGRVLEHSRQTAHDSAVHVQTQQRTQTHDGGGRHDHGTWGGGTHDGGRHLGGGTHGGGTHDGGTYDE